MNENIDFYDFINDLTAESSLDDAGAVAGIQSGGVRKFPFSLFKTLARSIANITGTKSEFNTACTDGNFTFDTDSVALSRLPQTGATTGQVIQWNGSAWVPATVGGGLPYTSYVALISQSGTSAPTATVIYNNTGGTITWSRNSIGSYNATISGATFTSGKSFSLEDKTYCDDGSNFFVLRVERFSNTIFTINTVNGSGQTDNALSNKLIEIRIYA